MPASWLATRVGRGQRAASWSGTWPRPLLQRVDRRVPRRRRRRPLTAAPWPRAWPASGLVTVSLRQIKSWNSPYEAPATSSTGDPCVTGYAPDTHGHARAHTGPAPRGPRTGGCPNSGGSQGSGPRPHRQWCPCAVVGASLFCRTFDGGLGQLVQQGAHAPAVCHRATVRARSPQLTKVAPGRPGHHQASGRCPSAVGGPPLLAAPPARRCAIRLVHPTHGENPLPTGLRSRPWAVGDGQAHGRWVGESGDIGRCQPAVGNRRARQLATTLVYYSSVAHTRSRWSHAFGGL